jgi:hypothetical protein
VLLGLELVLLADFLLKILYGTVSELNYPLTFQAEEVIMMLMPQYMFIMTMFFFKENLSQKTAFQKKPQGAVNGRTGNPLILPMYTNEKVIHLKMAMSREGFL